MQWKRQMTLNMCDCIIPQYSLNIQMHILLNNPQYNFGIKFVHSKKGMTQEV